MNKLITLAALALVSTGALASNSVQEIGTDIVYGGAPVNVSAKSPFVQNGPENSQIATDLVYGSDNRDHGPEAIQPAEQIANKRQDIATDIIYGG